MKIAIFFSVLLYWSIKAQYTIIPLEQIIKSITPETNCYQLPWATNPINQCLTCIVKEAKKQKQTILDSSRILSNCFKLGFCSRRTFDDIKNYFDIKALDDVEVVSLIIQLIDIDTWSVPEITIPHSLLTSSGSLTEKGSEYLVKKTLISYLSRDFDTHIEVTKPEIYQGKQTRQLFFINSFGANNSLESYVLKELATGKIEAYRLELVKQNQPLKLFSQCRNKNWPCIILPKVTICYEDQKGTIHYLVLLLKAAGKSLNQLKKNCLESTECKKNIARCFETIGLTLANFQREFIQGEFSLHKKGLVHNDFNWDNIFFDLEKNRISYIDNETFAESLERRQELYTDIMQLFYAPASSVDVTELKELYSLIVPHFLNGYLKHMNQHEKIRVMRELIEVFKHSNKAGRKKYSDEISYKVKSTIIPLLIDYKKLILL